MTDTGNYPPKPNPMFDGANNYPRPEKGRNWPLIDATREFIAGLPVQPVRESTRGGDLVPNGWTQGAWRCGTGMCFAGWGAALAGATFLYPADDWAHSVKATAGPSRGEYMSANVAVKDADGKVWRVSEYATHVMGLTQHQADELFDGYNDLKRIDSKIKRMRYRAQPKAPSEATE